MNNYSDHNVDNTNYNEAFQKQFRNPDFKFNKKSASEMLAGLMLLGDFGTYAGENLYVSNGTWLGKNGSRYRMGWGGNQHAGARSIATSRAAGFRAAGRGLFLLSVGSSVPTLIGGNSYERTNTQIDLYFGAVGTFGGIIGLGINIIYLIGTSERLPYRGSEFNSPFMPDNTYVNPFTKRRNK